MAFEQFPDVEAFYLAHPLARLSPESDYGCWWKDDDGGTWAVTYVHRTGQVYAVKCGGVLSGHVRIGGETATLVSAGPREGPVLVLATLEPWSEEQDRARDFGARAKQHPDPFEQRAPRWADICGEQGSLTKLVGLLT